MPCRKIDDERMAVLHQNSGGIGKSIPSALEISLGLRPREISRVSGNLGRRGWIFQSLPPLGGARIQSALVDGMADFCNFILSQNSLHVHDLQPYVL